MTIASVVSDSDLNVASPLAYFANSRVPRKVFRKANEPSSSCSLAGTSGRHATTHECTSASEKDPEIEIELSSGSSASGGVAGRRVCSERGLMG